jgi:hypothetical protein
MNVLYLVRAMVFLLETVLNAAGMDMTLASDTQAPSGATLLGTAPALTAPVRTLKLTRGTGPDLQTFWVGYWNLPQS